MALEKIGLEAIFEDRQFTQRIAAYKTSLKGAEQAVNEWASAVEVSSRRADKAMRMDEAAAAQAKQLREMAREQERAAAAMRTFGMAAVATGAILTGLLTKMTMTAARTQELGIVMVTVGKNIGKSADEMAKFEEAVKAQGITASAARQSLVQMVQANIDLANATDMARLAQDAAVIAQMDSSEAFQYLITLTQRGSLIMARQLGLVVSWEDAYARMAATLDRTVGSLTQAEKLQARVNEVFRAGANIAGTYEAAMGSAGKQARSMARHIEELSVNVGEVLLPVMGMVVSTATDFVKMLNAIPGPLRDTIVQVAATSGVLLTLAGTAALVIPKIREMVVVLKALRMVQMVGGLGPAAGLVAGAVAITGLITYFKKLEKAHRDEAAQILKSTDSYSDYITKLKVAGREQYAFSEDLYNTIKALKETDAAFDEVEYLEAARELKTFIRSFRHMADAMALYTDGVLDATDFQRQFLSDMRETVSTFSDVKLQVMASEVELRKWFFQMGVGAEQAGVLAKAVSGLAKAEQDHRMQLQQNLEAGQKWAEGLKAAAVAAAEAKNAAFDLADELQYMVHETKAEYIALKALSEETGIAVDVLRKYKTELGFTDDHIRELLQGLTLTSDEFKNLVKETGLTRARIKELNKELDMGEDEILDYDRALESTALALGMTRQEVDLLAQKMRWGTYEVLEYAESFERLSKEMGKLQGAAKEAQRQYEQFFSSLSSGMVQVRGLDEAMAESAENYKAALKGLRKSASETYDDIRSKYENSLPDRTTVAERMEMAADAWDEWALRTAALLDGVQGDHEQYWNDIIRKEAEGAGIIQRESETTYDYLSRIIDAFYAGELPDLLLKDTAAWRLHQAENKAIQDQELADVRARNAEQERIMEEARQKELAAQQAAKERLVLIAALGLAEQTGDLQEWASKFGPLVGLTLDTAAEVIEALDAGLIEIGPDLQDLITTFEVKFMAALGATGDQAEMTQEKLDGIFDTAEVGAEDAIIALDAMKARLAELEAVKAIAVHEDPELLGDPEKLSAIQEEIDAITEKIGPDGPLGEGAQLFQEDLDGITDRFADIVVGIEDVEGAMIALAVLANTKAAEVATAYVDAGDDILTKWVSESVISDLIKGTEEWGDEWMEQLDERVLPKLEEFQEALEALGEQVTVTKIEIVDPPPVGPVISPEERIDQIVKDFEKIPSEITTDIQIQQQPYEPIVSNQQNVTVGGDSTTYNVNDPLSMALAQSIVAEHRRQRRSEFMGA